MLRVTAGAEATSEVPLYAAEDVERGGIMRRGLDSLLVLGYPLDAVTASQKEQRRTRGFFAAAALTWHRVKFITFEGGEGSGKSTQAAAVGRSASRNGASLRS